MFILYNLQIFLNFLGIIIIIALVNVWLLIPTIFLGVIFVYLRRFYLSSARDVKRLEGISKLWLLVIFPFLYNWLFPKQV